MRLSIVIACSCLLAACSGGNHASNPEPAVVAPTASVPNVAPISAAALAEVDAYVQAQMAQQHVPGLSLVIAQDGKTVFAKGYGMADTTAKTPVTPDTVFHIGSITKQFTATAIMMLVQDGRIKLDDPITTYFPTAPATWKNITVRHLLHHTSGLPRDFPVETLQTLAAQPTWTVDQIVRMAGTVPLENATGAVMVYSNLGYHLLGLLVEKTSGQYFADYLRQRVFTPLGMTSADVISTARTNPALATGYAWEEQALRPASTWPQQPYAIEGEGGLRMSARDLAKWDAALLGERYLSKTSLAEMWTPTRLNDGGTAPYGFGWVLDEINHHPYAWHDGRLSGFTSQFVRHANEGLSVIVLSNLDDVRIEKIASRISAIVNPALDWAAAPDPQPQTGVLLRAMVDEAVRGAFTVDERFDPSLRAALTAEKVRDVNAYFSAWAPIERFGYVDQVEVDGKRVARYLVRSKIDQALFGIAVDANGRITFLRLLSE